MRYGREADPIRSCEGDPPIQLRQWRKSRSTSYSGKWWQLLRHDLRGRNAQFRRDLQNHALIAEEVLYEFASGEATEPEAGLVQGTDGNLYGVTTTGADGNSHLYRWSLYTGYSDLYTFTGVDYLVAPLLQHTNGLFYAPSWQYGTGNAGYIYSVDMQLGPFVTFVRAQGKVGSVAEILGQGFTGATSVTFNGIAASFKVMSDTYITAVVPTRASTGPVVVVTAAGKLSSNKNFTVLH